MRDALNKRELAVRKRMRGSAKHRRRRFYKFCAANGYYDQCHIVKAPNGRLDCGRGHVRQGLVPDYTKPMVVDPIFGGSMPALILADMLVRDTNWVNGVPSYSASRSHAKREFFEWLSGRQRDVLHGVRAAIRQQELIERRQMKNEQLNPDYSKQNIDRAAVGFFAGLKLAGTA